MAVVARSSHGMLPALCTFALLAAAAPLAPDPAVRVVPQPLWPDEKTIASAIRKLPMSAASGVHDLARRHLK